MPLMLKRIDGAPLSVETEDATDAEAHRWSAVICRDRRMPLMLKRIGGAPLSVETDGCH